MEEDLISVCRERIKEIQKIMYKSCIPPEVFIYFSKDIRWYRERIRHLENTK